VGARGLEPPNLTDVNRDAVATSRKSHGAFFGQSVKQLGDRTVKHVSCCFRLLDEKLSVRFVNGWCSKAAHWMMKIAIYFR